MNGKKLKQPTQHKTTILLGSNILPEENIRKAAIELNRLLNILRFSSVWKTPSVGAEGPDFLNAGILAETHFPLRKLDLLYLKPLEIKLGRIRMADKNAPRTIDLDIIIYDDDIIDTGLFKLAHIALPIAELYPGLSIPGSSESLAELSGKLQKNNPGITRLDINLQQFAGINN